MSAWLGHSTPSKGLISSFKSLYAFDDKTFLLVNNQKTRSSSAWTKRSQRVNRNDHKSISKEQCNRRWSTLSLLLPMQNQSTILRELYKDYTLSEFTQRCCTNKERFPMRYHYTPNMESELLYVLWNVHRKNTPWTLHSLIISMKKSLYLGLEGGKCSQKKKKNFKKTIHCFQLQILERLPKVRILTTSSSQETTMKTWQYMFQGLKVPL